ncbi:McrBC 5-methylcytosine restriction system component [Nonomuraea rosea]|uniref:McrBC 5-methylcytosine restriction system component n=2 Tax=Nonomuraea rosea TaxID=638574 RepID=A0ABP6VZT6_9ACTN
MTSIELIEHAPARQLTLDDMTGQALAASGIAEAAPDPWIPGQWRIRAGTKVGVTAVTLPDGRVITVRIRPKVPIARLLFLLGYSRNPKGWRTDEVPMAEETELLPVLARLFAVQTEEALRQGLIQGYQPTEETALIVRGRIREADQIRKHHGRFLPLEIAHDEFTADIAENRLLRTACERLLRLPVRVSKDTRGKLQRLRVRLAEITPIDRGHQVPSWRASRLNARYHKALRLAELVLHGSSVEHHPGDVMVSGFLFDMARVFEDFVTVALREALADDGGHCVLQDGHHLDEDRQIRIVPDFVRYSGDGIPVAVADAKYKAEKPEGFPDADLYQMLSYCTALNLPEGHLVYAKGNATHAAHRVRHAGITIHQHALDLDQPPAELLDEIGALARLLST